ncbi:ABC transporter permease [Bacillus massiliigorillae]|uniref:ABC transporter permease n=1 Tax=Bacillus massiliigorillae TaxID=1243664 RepID=UPI0003A8D581|nr:ABC transporter permease [Bacillus massiliigorillae]
MKEFIRRYAITISIGIVVLGIWVVCTTYGGFLNPVIFPKPITVLKAFSEKSSELIQGFGSSMRLLLPGYAAALILGIVGGVYFGLKDRIRQIFMPYFHTLSPIPPTLFIPYAIALLPTFKSASVFLIFLGSFWPIFLGTIQGVILIEKHYLDNAKTLGLKGGDYLFKVILPASSPHILSGASSALGLSFLILTMAEMFGAESGMGYFIQYYTDFSQYDHVLAGIFFNSIVILVFMLLFEKIRKRLLFWTNIKGN